MFVFKYVVWGMVVELIMVMGKVEGQEEEDGADFFLLPFDVEPSLMPYLTRVPFYMK